MAIHCKMIETHKRSLWVVCRDYKLQKVSTCSNHWDLNARRSSFSLRQKLNFYGQFRWISAFKHFVWYSRGRQSSISISVVNPTRCINVSVYFILEWHSTCFGRSFRPSSGVQDFTYSNRHLSNRYCWLLASKQAVSSISLVALCTGLFEMIFGVQLSSGNSAPNWGNNHHLTIPFEGGMHSFKRQGDRVSRNWRYKSEPPLKPSPLTCYKQFGTNSIIVFMFVELQRVHI